MDAGGCGQGAGKLDYAAGFRKADRLRAFDAEKLFQVGGRVMLHHRIMREVREDFRAAAFRDIRGDQNEVQLALAAAQRVATDEQNRRAQRERKQPLHR